MEFKKGQKIICVDNFYLCGERGSGRWNLLKVGNVYEVLESRLYANYWEVRLKCEDGGTAWFLTDRFAPHSPRLKRNLPAWW